MFFILQIMMVGLLAVVITTAVSVAVVWVKRQTHVKLTPGQLARDRVLVAESEERIAASQVREEMHKFWIDRMIDARQAGELPEAILEALPKGDTQSPLHSKLDQKTKLGYMETLKKKSGPPYHFPENVSPNIKGHGSRYAK